MVLRSFILCSVLRWKTEFCSKCVAVVLANISIQGRVIDSNIYCFFYGCSNIVPLPAYYFEG